MLVWLVSHYIEDKENRKKIRSGIYVIEWEKPVLRTETSES